MNKAIVDLHAALEKRWAAAGKPAGATEMSLWDMERVIDNIPQQLSAQEILTEGVELLEAWIENDKPSTEEAAAIAFAQKELKAIQA